MYVYRSLADTPYAEIARCFQAAFSDYAISIQLTEQQLQRRLEMSGIHKDLSFGAFAGSEMVGFIFNACSLYQGEQVAFDIGTGVVPAHRGKRVFADLFAFNEQALLKRGITRYYLEVLQQNEKAIAIYKKLGFQVARGFSVLKSSSPAPATDCQPVRCLPFADFRPEAVQGCTGPTASFEHSTGILRLNPEQYEVAVPEGQQRPSAFCIYDKSSGNLVQLGYADAADLKPILAQLLTRFETMVAKNIDLGDTQALELLRSMGFTELVRQFEMVKAMEP